MNRTLVISEIGINHGGAFGLAYRMINLSKWAGADIAKFQYYDPEEVLGKTHAALKEAKACQFTKKQHEELKAHCDEIGIEYLVSVFNVKDLAWANRLCKRIKVATRMNKNVAFIDAAVKTGKQVLVSTDSPYQMCNPRMIQMYCIPKYPTSLDEVNKWYLDCCEGISTHCPSIAPALRAVANNCRVVEAHTTEHRKMPGTDISSSWTFEEMKQFVGIVRDWEKL